MKTVTLLWHQDYFENMQPLRGHAYISKYKLIHASLYYLEKTRNLLHAWADGFIYLSFLYYTVQTVRADGADKYTQYSMLWCGYIP